MPKRLDRQNMDASERAIDLVKRGRPWLWLMLESGSVTVNRAMISDKFYSSRSTL